MRLGFVGAGNMAGGLARGWAAAKGEPGSPEAMLFADADPDRARALAEEVGGQAIEGNRALAEESDLVVLAVKPNVLDQVAEEVAAAGNPVISILAGTSLETLAKALPGIELVRVMPNLGAQLRQAVLCVVFPDGADDAHRQRGDGAPRATRRGDRAGRGADRPGHRDHGLLARLSRPDGGGAGPRPG